MNDTNSTQPSTHCKYDQPYSDVEKAFQLAALSIVGGFGLFGNIFTIIIAAKYTVRRNLHFLIINMAVSDTLVIVTIVLYATRIIGYQIWDDNVAANLRCKAVVFLGSTFEAISLVSLVIISIERYRITRIRAVQVPRQHSVKRRVCLLGGSWLVSLLVHLYEAILRRATEQGLCVERPQFVHSLCTLIRLILYMLFFVVLLVLSVLTLRRLSRPQTIENNLTEAQRQLRKKRIGSAVTMVLYSLLLYCCCYLPFLIIQIFFAIGYLFPTARVLLKLDGCIDWAAMYFITAFLLPVVNSALSPCVYFVCLSDFRQAAKTLLCKYSGISNNSISQAVDLSPQCTNNVSRTSIITKF